MRRLRFAAALLPALLCVLTTATGCGGGGGSSPSQNVLPSTAPVSVVVNPATANVRVGDTQQFTAAVTGTSNTTVTWSVNGVAGGAAATGTISATGLYTPPATVPANNSITV